MFDYFNEENKVPYILSDLNHKSTNSLVDNNLDGKDIKNGLKEFNSLINDLIRWANPQYVLSSNPGVGDNSNKIINRVYYNNDNTKPTGILRIRPKSNSDLRFCEQTITFTKETEAFEQVKKIIKKHLPYVDISDEKDFQVFVNYASALKRADEDLYDVAIKRRDKKKSLLVKNFIDNFKGKKKLSDEEYALFDEFVGLTLKTFDELRKQDPIFDFEIVDQMVGGIKSNEK